MTEERIEMLQEAIIDYTDRLNVNSDDEFALRDRANCYTELAKLDVEKEINISLAIADYENHKNIHGGLHKSDGANDNWDWCVKNQL